MSIVITEDDEKGLELALVPSTDDLEDLGQAVVAQGSFELCNCFDKVIALRGLRRTTRVVDHQDWPGNEPLDLRH